MNYLSQNEIIKINKKKKDYIIVFFVIYLSSSFYAVSLPGKTLLLLSIFLAFFSILVNYKNITINTHSYYFLLFLIISSILTLISNQDDVYNYLIFWIVLFVAYSIYVSIKLNDFIYIYIDIMYFLALFSLITFIFSILFPAFPLFFPNITNTANLTVSNLFFSVLHYTSDMSMNFGLFWEPGAYQTFINLALFFHLFVVKELNIKKIIVFIFTIFTTFSSTGYLATMLLLFIFLLINPNILKYEFKKYKKIVRLLLGLIILGIITFNFLPNIIKFKVFGKLKILLGDQGLNNQLYSSTTVRMDSIKYPLMDFMDNPFVGVGISNLYQSAIDNGYNMITSTPVNWFGFFGFFVGLSFIFLLLNWSSIVKGAWFTKLLLLLFLLLIVISENYNRNIFYLLFIFYSFDVKKFYNNHYLFNR